MLNMKQTECSLRIVVVFCLHALFSPRHKPQTFFFCLVLTTNLENLSDREIPSSRNPIKDTLSNAV